MPSLFVDTQRANSSRGVSSEDFHPPPLTPSTPCSNCVSFDSSFTFHSNDDDHNNSNNHHNDDIHHKKSIHSQPTKSTSSSSSPFYNHSSRRSLVPPSPRSRLDPQYASRLHRPSSSHHQCHKSPTGIERSNENMDIFRTPCDTPDRPNKFSIEIPSPSSSSRHYSTPRRKNSRCDSWSTASPIPDNTGCYSDRFIPSRASSNLSIGFWSDNSTDSRSEQSTNHSQDLTTHHAHSSQAQTTHGGNLDHTTETNDTSTDDTTQNQHQPPLFNALLRSELLGENQDPSRPDNHRNTMDNSPHRRNRTPSTQPLTDGGNFLRFQNNPVKNYTGQESPTSIVDAFNLSPVASSSTQRRFFAPQKQKRRIAKVPFKVLDAPALQDDFYLNLVDWSSQNVLAVGLGSCVYLWSACTSKVTKLCDLTPSDDIVTSVSWAQRGTHVAVGTNRGEVQLWDTIQCKKIRTMAGHSARIGTLAWNGPTLASGSRDRQIYLRDVRAQHASIARLAAHKQEVCGLKWSHDEPSNLASGGNDNKLLVWDIKKHTQPLFRFAKHSAAVKAISWSPHQHGLLASGGGTADRCIRFWNALSGTSLDCIDTGSQVCNLAWSKNCNEIVSTHGYSLNQIVVWKYPNMQKVATLTGHTYRVLYLALSPDGSTIVT